VTAWYLYLAYGMIANTCEPLELDT